MTNYRLKITDVANNVTYIERRDGRVSYFSAYLTPLSLSSLVGNEAAETSFALQDAEDGQRAYNRLVAVLDRQWKNAPGQRPRVMVLVK